MADQPRLFHVTAKARVTTMIDQHLSAYIIALHAAEAEERFRYRFANEPIRSLTISVIDDELLFGPHDEDDDE